MSFSSFFSKQAQKPSGLFGRIVMANVFDIGNAYLNEMVNDALAIENNDHVLDIGCGTGKLIWNMANQISEKYIEGVDFSHSMVSIGDTTSILELFYICFSNSLNLLVKTTRLLTAPELC